MGINGSGCRCSWYFKELLLQVEDPFHPITRPGGIVEKQVWRASLRDNMSIEEETAFPAPFFNKADHVGIL
jgi:hypothetical protein